MESIAPALLRWYDQNKRVLPFRTVSTPYRVWVSEIMLQQWRRPCLILSDLCRRFPR